MSNSEKVIEREHYDKMRIKLQTRIDELEARHTPEEYEEYGKEKYEEGVAEAEERCEQEFNEAMRSLQRTIDELQLIY